MSSTVPSWSNFVHKFISDFNELVSKFVVSLRDGTITLQNVNIFCNGLANEDILKTEFGYLINLIGADGATWIPSRASNVRIYFVWRSLRENMHKILLCYK
jgi:hypothetical protein